MKLVIDISEEVKEKIAIMGLDRLDVWNIRLVSKAISDGIPLDDIKNYLNEDTNLYRLYDAINIIEAYRKGAIRNEVV